MSHRVDGADERLLSVKQRSEVAVGKCVGRQDLRQKRGTSGFSAAAEICLSSVALNSYMITSSFTNIFQGTRLLFPHRSPGVWSSGFYTSLSFP